ncbi:MAG: hypothetical protein SCARUB_04238 [Candidatus Scalindua rubra]|uniref:Uncharacterized protein n=1 Tax=Candidatus Scalindua rubra TaxID=1872076 RepID=A0A1E3X519_9BACT|nr:MAG: hypothetical protein SCARUB_04238 [Candidatus Scalindua rubra]
MLIFLITGCSHQLAISNPDDYYSSTPYINKSISLGVLPPQSQDAERLVNEIVDNLRGLGNIKVISPYAKSAGNPVDYILDFNIQTKYSGDGMNFLISFPGFLIFAPWWNGYNYKANLNTKVTFTEYNSNQVVTTQTYDTQYRCKQSEFDRTWTQGADWLLTYGIASLIGGIVFTNYDNDITSDFVRSFSQPYGSYIARKVGTLLNSL